MDVTNLFKACIKTVRATNKDLGVSHPKSSILKNATRDELMVKAREILKHLTNLHQFIEDNKVDYLNLASNFSTKKSMNDMDRQEIDVVAQKVINTTITLIKEFKQEIAKKQLTAQKLQHYNNVIEFTDNYHKTVTKIYNNTKAIRLKRIMETNKIRKLESMHKITEDKVDIMPKTNKIKLINNIEKEVAKEEKIKPPVIPISQNSSPVEDLPLSAEEMQMFEEENAFLYNELNSLNDEVKQMENKVVHIAELQELFTEKVLEQEKDIDRISHVVAATTDTVKDANEQIRQAIQRNAGLRVWVLFFLIIMSFSLLFLDWYND